MACLFGSQGCGYNHAIVAGLARIMRNDQVADDFRRLIVELREKFESAKKDRHVYLATLAAPNFRD
jgi:hypothetical protein